MDINCSIDDMLQTLSSHTMTPEDITEWLDCDSRIRTHEPLSDNEIIDKISRTSDLEPPFNENSHIDTVEEDTASTSNTEAAPTDREAGNAGNAFDTSVKWLEHHGYPDVNFVEKLASLRNYALGFK